MPSRIVSSGVGSVGCVSTSGAAIIVVASALSPVKAINVQRLTSMRCALRMELEGQLSLVKGKTILRLSLKKECSYRFPNGREPIDRINGGPEFW